MLVDRGVAPLSRSGRPEAFDARQQYPDIGPEPGKPRIPQNRSQAWCKTTKPRGRSPGGTAPTPPGRGRRRLSSPARSHQFELGLFRLHPAQGHVPLRETVCTPRRPRRRGTLPRPARGGSARTPRRPAPPQRTGRVAGMLNIDVPVEGCWQRSRSWNEVASSRDTSTSPRSRPTCCSSWAAPMRRRSPTGRRWRRGRPIAGDSYLTTARSVSYPGRKQTRPMPCALVTTHGWPT